MPFQFFRVAHREIMQRSDTVMCCIKSLGIVITFQNQGAQKGAVIFYDA